MVVEVAELRLVLVADVDYGDAFISQVFGGRLTSLDGGCVLGEQKRAGEQVVFVRGTRMG